MIVPFSHVLFLSGVLFLMGIFCAVARRNLIMIVLGVEIMLNAASIVFVGAALRWINARASTPGSTAVNRCCRTMSIVSGL